MKLFIFITMFCSLMPSLYAATSMIYSKHPEYPNKCVIEPELMLSPGDIIKDPDTDCGQIMCGGNGMAFYHGCSIFVPPNGCYLGKFVRKDDAYPGCCERKIICGPKTNNN